MARRRGAEGSIYRLARVFFHLRVGILVKTWIEPPQANVLYILKPHVKIGDLIRGKEPGPEDIWLAQMNHRSFSNRRSIDYLGRRQPMYVWARTLGEARRRLREIWPVVSSGRRIIVD